MIDLWISLQVFVPFLPQDEQSLDEISEAATQQISEDLGWLLSQDAQAFWEVVQRNQSLRTCIDSYLRFKRCVGVRSAWATA